MYVTTNVDKRYLEEGKLVIKCKTFEQAFNTLNMLRGCEAFTYFRIRKSEPDYKCLLLSLREGKKVIKAIRSEFI